MPSKKPQNPEYFAKTIGQNSSPPREHVRRRPGMYVGGTDKRAFHNMLWQCLDESISESLQFPSLTEIRITLLSDIRIKITDNGLGISTEAHKSGKSIFEVYMTDIGLRRANYVFNGSNNLSGGLHGIHMYMINALSLECIAEAKREGYLWRQTYQECIPITQVEQIRPLAEDESTGTSITFTPDFTIMDEGLSFDYDLIIERCQELAYLLPQVTFKIESEDKSTTLHHENGIQDWVTDLNNEAEALHPMLYKDNTLTVMDRRNQPYTIRVVVAFQFRGVESAVIKSFVNTIKTSDAGTHVEGFRESLIQAIYGEIGEKLIDPLTGLVAVLHVYHPDPQFHSQTKVELLNPEIKEAVADCVKQLLAENLDIHAQLQGYFRI